MIAHGGNNYEILLAAELSDQSRRLVQAKEIFHILLDEDRYHSMDLYAHVEATAECFRIETSMPKNAVVIEFLAHIAAMEFLFPYRERVKIISQQGDREVDYGLVAHKFGIPQIEVEKFLVSSNIEELGKVYALMR
jgi:Zn-dependent peptidase ImmA (M78 family)